MNGVYIGAQCPYCGKHLEPQGRDAGRRKFERRDTLRCEKHGSFLMVVQLSPLNVGTRVGS